MFPAIVVAFDLHVAILSTEFDVAQKTKGHIKALMHQFFENAMLWELLSVGRNPDGTRSREGHQQKDEDPDHPRREKQCFDSHRCLTRIGPWSPQRSARDFG